MSKYCYDTDCITEDRKQESLLEIANENWREIRVVGQLMNTVTSVKI